MRDLFPPVTKKSDIEYVIKLFHARDVIHLAHLKTQSYAQHIALNDFYEGILDFADSIAEKLQGQEKQLLNLSIPQSTAEEPVSYLTGLRASMLSWRESTKYEWLKNQIDEIVALINTTLYKLTFLK